MLPSSIKETPQEVSAGPCHPVLKVPVTNNQPNALKAKTLFVSLSILDRFLAPIVLIAMILGVVIGVYAPNVQQAFNQVQFAGVSVPIVVGMIVMMWPALTKVQYEKLPTILTTRALWEQIVVSLILNWVIGPFVMFGCAWAALPDLPTYRTGVIMVGLARCIAMVMIWNSLAGGDPNLCAIIVIVNSILQIILYSPYALLFLEVMAKSDEKIGLQYGPTAIAVLIYLGIPLILGLITRFILLFTIGQKAFHSKFLPFFSPLALIGLLYTIIVIFAQQAQHILHNLGPVFRVFVPMIMYFIIMFGMTFSAMYWWSNHLSSVPMWMTGGRIARRVGYEEAAVQSFTAASNNFELSIAVCVAVFGVDSDQALAATIGPLVEVPVLLSLTWVALYLKRKLRWGDNVHGEEDLEMTSTLEGRDSILKLNEHGGQESGCGFDRGGTIDVV